MKKSHKIIAIILLVIISILISFVVIVHKKMSNSSNITTKKVEAKVFYSESKSVLNDTTVETDKLIKEEIRKTQIVYDNLTLEELGEKLERSMNSSLDGKGYMFASYCMELGLDPYLALAIVLHETGCSYQCSSLVRTHNNLGGLKGSNGYLYFDTLEDGIKGYLDILYKNYYSKGLTTPELMNPAYAASTTWASKVNFFINKIKNN